MAIRKSTHLLMLLISVSTYAAPAPENKETGLKKNNLPTDDLKAASSSYSHQYSDWGGSSPGGYGFSVTGLGIVDGYTNKPGYKRFGGYDNSLKSTGNSALNGIGYEGAGYNGYFGSNNLSPDAATGYGTNGYGTSGFGANGYGNSGFGANGYGNSGFGANGYGSRGYSANAYGSSGFGTNGYGSSGFGANGYGTSGFAASGYGGNEYSSGYDNTGYISNNLGFGQKGFDRSLGNGGYGGFGGNGGLNSYYGYNNPNYIGGGHLGYVYYKGNIYNNGVTPNLVTGYRGYTRR